MFERQTPPALKVNFGRWKASSQGEVTGGKALADCDGGGWLGDDLGLSTMRVAQLCRRIARVVSLGRIAAVPPRQHALHDKLVRLDRVVIIRGVSAAFAVQQEHGRV